MTNLERLYHQSGSKREFATAYFTYLGELMAQVDVGAIEQIIDAFVAASERRANIYFIGNGGSAATASHFANDISIGTRAGEAPTFKAISLVDNAAIMTALGNDEGFDKVFVRQLKGTLLPTDVLVGLSVSGNSPNIVEAVRYAKNIGALVIGCTGFDGGALRELADIKLHIPAPRGEYGPVEDIFQVLDHLIYSYLRITRRGKL